MATQLDLVNNLLVRLREKKVNSTQDNSYSLLLSRLVAEAHEEVVDDWNWQVQQRETSVVVPAGTVSRVIDVLDVFDEPLGRDTFIERKYGDAYMTWVKESPSSPNFDSTAGVPVTEMGIADLRQLRRQQGVVTQEFPSHIALFPKASNDELELHLLQANRDELTLVIQFYVRPFEFKDDGTTDTNELEIPFRPVQELAMMYALNERGEEMGEPGNVAEKRYLRALAAAKEQDIKSKESSNVLDWRRD